MNCGRSAGALGRSQFASCKGRRAHGARPFSQRPHVVEQPLTSKALTAPLTRAGISPSLAFTASPNTDLSELRHV